MWVIAALSSNDELLIEIMILTEPFDFSEPVSFSNTVKENPSMGQIKIMLHVIQALSDLYEKL